jgi:tetratricopeptide (TPR) repeat protein
MDWAEAEKRVLLSRIYEMRRQRLYDQMEEEIQNGLERFPSDRQLGLLQADSLRRRGRLSEAQRALDNLRERCESQAQFHGLQGTLQFQRREYEKALESFCCAHSLDPNSYYLKRQADCLLALGRFAPALAVLREIEPQARDTYTLSALARAHEGMGSREEAVCCYQELLRLAPDDNFAKGRLLRLKTAAKEEGDAEKEIDRMLRVPSRREDPVLLSVRAEQLKKRGDFRGAAEIYLRLLQNEPGPQRPFFERLLAFAYFKAEAHEEALPLFQSLLKENPQDPYLRNALMTTARKTGRRKELAEFFRSVARLSPANSALYGFSRRLERESENDPE